MSAPPTVVVAGLGPADADLIPAGVLRRLAEEGWWLRTAHHPAATAVNAVGSFDHFYDRADTFRNLYEAIVEALVTTAGRQGRVNYAVPGSPRVLERTVDLLMRRAAAGEVLLEVLPAMSFLDLAWAALGIDPVTAGVRLVDGHRFAADAAGQRGPLLVAHTHSRAVLSDIKLAVLDDEGADPTEAVMVLAHLGLPDQRVRATTWAELDRGPDPDHLTSLWVPRLAAPVGAAVQRLVDEVAAADRQPAEPATGASPVAAGLVDVAAETVERAGNYEPATGEGAGELLDGLGGVLGEVVVAARRGERDGWFSLADVAEAARERRRRRSTPGTRQGGLNPPNRQDSAP